MSPLRVVKCPHCETKITVKVAGKGAAKGAAKGAVGCFVLAILFEVFPDLAAIGPTTTIAVTWLMGQIFYSALSPQQWKALLGNGGE